MKKALCFLVFIAACFSAGAQALNVDSLIVIWKGAKEDTGKVIVSRMIAGTLRQTNPAEGVRFGLYGAALGKRLGFDKGTAGCYLNVSACYSAGGRLDSSLAYIDTAIYYSIKAGDANRLSLVYLNRADIHMQLQYFEKSLRDCDTSLLYAEKVNSDDRRARVLQTFGSIYFFQELYDQSEAYYLRANELYKRLNNRQMSAIVYNNLALVHKNAGRLDTASQNILLSIQIAREVEDLNNLGMYFGTLSDIRFLKGRYAEALQFADSALRYGRLINNNISMANAWGYQGQALARLGRHAEAITALSRGYQIFRDLEDYDKINSSSGILAETYAASGDYRKAFEYQRISRASNDTLAKRRYRQDVAAMQTRFEVREKDKAIQLLDQNRQLQEQRLSRQRLLMFALAALALFVLAAAALLISRSRHRQQLKELRLRNAIAADLHDEVGSSLSSIHLLSEMVGADGEKGVVIDRMRSYAKETMEKMGDIVWMIKPAEEAALKDRMGTFLRDICDSRRISCSFRAEELERLKLSVEQRKAVYLIFKEAVNNAVKYAQARHIDVSVAADGKRLRLVIQDDGVGFDASVAARGNGLENMQSRARELGGSTHIESSSGKGTRIVCSVPI